MKQMRIASLALALSAGAFAHAGEVCDVLVLTSSDDEAVIGNLAYEDCVPAVGCWFPPSTNRYGACVRSRTAGGSFGPWTLVPLPGCNGAAVGDVIGVEAGAGHDKVAAMRVEYYPRNQVAEFTCSMRDQNHRLIRAAIRPSGGVVGLDAEMGTGRDQFFGSDADDVAYSNYVYRVSTGSWTYHWRAPADRSSDALCGYGGDDWLVGDEDNGPVPGSSFLIRSETLDGGWGDDSCAGDTPPMWWFIGPGESTVDGADTLGCERERQGRPGTSPSATVCATRVMGNVLFPGAHP